MLAYRRPGRAAKTSLCEPRVRQQDRVATAVPHIGQAVGDGAALAISCIVSYWLTTRIRGRSKVQLAGATLSLLVLAVNCFAQSDQKVDIEFHAPFRTSVADSSKEFRDKYFL